MSKFILYFTRACRSLQLSVIRNMTKMANDSKPIINASDSWFTKYNSCMDVPEGIFKGYSDRFNGVTVDSMTEKVDSSEFPNMLHNSLKYWKENKKRGIWFKINLENSDWVPILTKNGFNFHHAREGFVMMYRWLPKDEYVNIPPYAHTMVGVGAVVVNDKNEVLVVSERYALIPGSWKLPGGYAEPGENLSDATVREVLEETNIKTTFETLISVRHAHGAGFGCSDLYLVMGMIPETTDIQKCDREIANSKWMDVEEYLNHSNVHETNKNFLKTYLEYKDKGIKIDCCEAVHQILKKKYQLFSANLSQL